jgi:predicted acyltransferase
MTRSDTAVDPQPHDRGAVAGNRTAGEGRLLALDVFRGATIAGMILVNMPGSWSHIYAPMRHAAWHGATPTDLIFPFFLFVVGVAMWFSFGKYDRSLSGSLARKIFRRVVLIFVVGLFLNAYPFTGELLTNLRVMGVLQRIALAYGLAALLCLTLGERQLIGASVAILLGYWAILAGFGGPEPYTLEGNVAGRIDRAVFGDAHVWHGFGVPFDPEGLLATIPAVVTVVLGYFAGKWITTSDRHDAILTMFLTGTLLTVGGLVWDPFFPINKPLWTSSYVAYTGGIALVALAWFIWLIDVRGYRRWTTPFRAFGLNPLFAFVLSGVLARTLTRLIHVPVAGGETITGYRWLYTRIFEPVAGPLNGSLLFAVSMVALIWLAILPFYRKGIVIKI